jgi:hypothetical protein
MAKSKEEEAQAPEAVAIEPSEFDSLLKKSKGLLLR